MKKSTIKSAKGAIVFTQIAFTVVIIVIGCVWLAHKCMEWFNWGNWCLVVGALLGTASAMYYMFMHLYTMIKEEEKDKDA